MRKAYSRPWYISCNCLEFSVLIERSHSHDVKGRVAAILRRMYRLGKSSGSHAFTDAAHESTVIIPGCTYIFQRSNSAKKSCGEGRSSLYRSTKSVSCWAVIWLYWITDGTNRSSFLTLIGYHAYQVRYAYRSGQSCQFIWRSPPEDDAMQSLFYEAE